MHYLLDWKVKLGITLSCILFLACSISFVIAWNAPQPTDAMSAVTKVFSYRLFGVLFFSFISIVTVTYGVYRRRLRSF